jgi:peptide/nickel transport system ATP-binding protein
MTPAIEKAPLVEVENMVKTFHVGGGLLRQGVAVPAVRDVSFTIREGETLGLVGESGSGKSTVGRLLLRLDDPTGGTMRFAGQDLIKIRPRAMRELRRQMQVIFQDPYASLNPRMRVGDYVEEPLIIHGTHPDRRERRDYVAEHFRMVGLDPAFGRRYPHEFSGGQRQRVVIARAIALKPRFVVADEPITALDVSIQAQIVNLLQDLQRELKLTYLFIAHDLSMVRYLCHRVAVMCRGRIVEMGDCATVFDHPLHLYTQSLLSAVPIPDPDRERQRKRITSDPAELTRSLEGRLVEVEPGHHVLKPGA